VSALLSRNGHACGENRGGVWALSTCVAGFLDDRQAQETPGRQHQQEEKTDLCSERVQHRTAFGSSATTGAISVSSRPQKERCVMRFQTRFLLIMALVAAVGTPLPRAVDPQPRAAVAAPAGGDAVLVWNANAGVAATKACIAPLDDPFHESRLYAMMHIAIHDALNAIDRRFRPT
jgi:hypothetical protein